MKSKARFGATLLAIALGASLALTTASAATKADFDSALASASSSIKRAASIGGEWRDSDKILKKALEAAEKGDFDKALKLANTAKFQGDMGFRQAMSQQGAGARF